MLHPALVPVLLSAFLQQPAPHITQVSTGWCSPNIANVVGNVTVNCIGVDPRALSRLNAELSRKKLDLASEIQEANTWTTRYKDLEAHLAQAGDESVLSKQAEEYLHEGDLTKAGETLDQILGGEEDEVGRVAANHFNRALVFELQFRNLDALPHLKLAFQYRPEKPEYGQEYSNVLLEENRFPESEKVATSVVATLQPLAKTDPAKHQPALSSALNVLAICYMQTQRFKEAEDVLQEVIDLDRQFARTNPALATPNLAASLGNLSYLYSKTQRFTEAISATQEALALYRQLAETNPTAYYPRVALQLNNLASLFQSIQETGQAFLYYDKALGLRRELAKINPNAYTPDLADALHHAANLNAQMNRPEDAEPEYREALELYRQSAKANPDAYRPALAATLSDFGILYRTTKRPAEAEAVYLEAIELNRQLVQARPGTYEADLANALDNLGTVYKDQQRTKDAETVALESLAIRRHLAQQNPQVYAPDLSASLMNLGYLYLLTQRYQDSETASKEAMEILRKLAKENPVVYRPDLAAISYGLGLLYLQTQKPKQAEMNLKEALDILRDLNVNSQRRSLLSSALDSLGALYKSQKRFAEAGDIFEEEEAEELRLSPGPPEEEAVYASFGDLFFEMHLLDEAENSYKQALSYLPFLAGKDPATYKSQIPLFQQKLAYIQTQLHSTPSQTQETKK
jgi:tetratricopeptide (TPR) repeat protein